MGDDDEMKASAKAGKRLRLSILDFNASFAKLTGGVMGVDDALLDIFKTSRIDDYTLVNTVFFDGQSASHDAKPPTWRGIAPLSRSSETDILGYLRALIAGMHKRGQQVIVSYTLDEGPGGSRPPGQGFNAWLAAATTAQVTAHAKQIVDFFVATHKLEIDGIDFDLEIVGLGKNPNHAPNLKTLYVETAKALAVARPGASVSYDNATFQGSDGKPALSWFEVQPYAIATGAPNLIARPMHNLGAKADAAQIQKSIDIAMKVPGFTPSKLQIIFSFFDIGKAKTIQILKSTLAPAQVGYVLYNMGARSKDAASLTSFAADCVDYDKALNGPAAAEPGKKGAPLQAPLPRALP